MTLLGRARSVFVFVLAAGGALFAGAAAPLLGTCGPFTDVAADAFCPFVLEIFTLGITTGTTPTTYDPAGNVTRLQMAAFLSRTVDGVVRRGSRRAALNQFWTGQHRRFPGDVDRRDGGLVRSVGVGADRRDRFDEPGPALCCHPLHTAGRGLHGREQPGRSSERNRL